MVYLISYVASAAPRTLLNNKILMSFFFFSFIFSLCGNVWNAPWISPANAWLLISLWWACLLCRPCRPEPPSPPTVYSLPTRTCCPSRSTPSHSNNTYTTSWLLNNSASLPLLHFLLEGERNDRGNLVTSSCWYPSPPQLPSLLIKQGASSSSG